MLKKFIESGDSALFRPGAAVYIVTKLGAIIEGYSIASTLGELVSLDRSPISGTEKQGFTIEGRFLKPNWCAGKQKFEAACIDKKEAETLVTRIKEEMKLAKRPLPEPCTSKSKQRNSP